MFQCYWLYIVNNTVYILRIKKVKVKVPNGRLGNGVLEPHRVSAKAYPQDS